VPQIWANRFLKSQTLYNECALVTENELVEKNFKEKIYWNSDL